MKEEKEKEKKPPIRQLPQRQLPDLAPAGIPLVLAPYLLSRPSDVQEEDMTSEKAGQHTAEFYESEIIGSSGKHADEIEMTFIREIQAIDTSRLTDDGKWIAARRVGASWREEDSRIHISDDASRESREP